MFSVLLSGAGPLGGAVVGTGGAGVGGGAELGGLLLSTDTLLLSLLRVPLDSWWLFSSWSGSVAARLASASFNAEGGAGGAPDGGPDALTPPPLTESDLKNNSRLLCSWKQTEWSIS